MPTFADFYRLLPTFTNTALLCSLYASRDTNKRPPATLRTAASPSPDVIASHRLEREEERRRAVEGLEHVAGDAPRRRVQQAPHHHLDVVHLLCQQDERRHRAPRVRLL